jgi:hypothetical protein
MTLQPDTGHKPGNNKEATLQSLTHGSGAIFPIHGQPPRWSFFTRSAKKSLTCCGLGWHNRVCWGVALSAPHNVYVV